VGRENLEAAWEPARVTLNPTIFIEIIGYSGGGVKGIAKVVTRFGFSRLFYELYAAHVSFSPSDLIQKSG
jgi:hypothetical protein